MHLHVNPLMHIYGAARYKINLRSFFAVCVDESYKVVGTKKNSSETFCYHQNICQPEQTLVDYWVTLLKPAKQGKS